jgi:hypothetical protein
MDVQASFAAPCQHMLTGFFFIPSVKLQLVKKLGRVLNNILDFLNNQYRSFHTLGFSLCPCSIVGNLLLSGIIPNSFYSFFPSFTFVATGGRQPVTPGVSGIHDDDLEKRQSIRAA